MTNSPDGSNRRSSPASAPREGEAVRVLLSVNGDPVDVPVAPLTRLSTLLRDGLGLVGTKVACGDGTCGACAVLVDGRPFASCLTLAAAVAGRSITTIEGVSRSGPTALQEAFVAEDATQCGFCTPGQIISATALLEANARPTVAEIDQAMAGNLCRCGTYPKIRRAILRASREGAA